MVTNASQTRNGVGLNKTVYCRVTASASSGTMKHRRGASEREPPGDYVQLRLCEMPLSLREHLLGSLEQSLPRSQQARRRTISFSRFRFPFLLLNRLPVQSNVTTRNEKRFSGDPFGIIGSEERGGPRLFFLRRRKRYALKFRKIPARLYLPTKEHSSRPQPSALRLAPPLNLFR